jgi:hypothetical protein
LFNYDLENGSWKIAKNCSKFHRIMQLRFMSQRVIFGTLANIIFEFASSCPHNYETSEAGKTHLRSGRQPLGMMPPTLPVYRAEGQRAGGKSEQQSANLIS